MLCSPHKAGATQRSEVVRVLCMLPIPVLPILGFHRRVCTDAIRASIGRVLGLVFSWSFGDSKEGEQADAL